MRIRVTARRRACASGLALVAAFGSAACGSDAVGRTDAAAATVLAGARFPDGGSLPATLTDSTGAEVTVSSTERIVLLNGDILEVVYALGLGENVVARDLSGTYPAQAERLPVIGYQRALAPEPIAALSPTVVIGNADAGPPGTIEALRRLAPVVILDYPDGLAGPAEKIRAVARVLGVSDRGERLAQEVEQGIAAAQADAEAADGEPRVALLYLRGAGTQLLMGRQSGATEIIEAAGGTDIAAELGVESTAELDMEALIAAAPDALVVTTSGLDSVKGIDGLLELGAGALARTPAGRDRRVLAYEDQYLLGFGPRTGELLAELTADLHDDPQDGR